MISVCIPTIGRPELLNSVLMGIFNNREFVGEVIILDQGDTPSIEAYQVSLVIDLLSLNNIRVNYIRQRHKKGIAENRYFLVKEAKNDLVMMVDDDVVLDIACIYRLYKALEEDKELNWTIPANFNIRKDFEDYISSEPISLKDERFIAIIEKRPWYLSYFNIIEDIVIPAGVSFSPAFLCKRDIFLDNCKDIVKLGKLPREDVYMYSKMGCGGFVTRAYCYHFTHSSQNRNWVDPIEYLFSRVAMSDPDKIVAFADAGCVKDYSKGLY